MIFKKLLKWNLSFTFLYLISSSFIYFISNDTSETIPIILLIGLIFNGIIVIGVLHKSLKKSVQKSFEKHEGGEKQDEESLQDAGVDEIIADDEFIDDDSYADDFSECSRC